MYHYVRPIKNSKYPNINGLELFEFKDQLNFFKKKGNIICENQLNDIIKKKKIPKKPSIFLTFDDGYKDHYNYVLPTLVKHKIKASFYPPQKNIENKIVLDVNKIHFILEKEQNSKKILNFINAYLQKKHINFFEKLDLTKINTSSRFDNKETILVKRLLQYFLPKNIRDKILDKLFEKIVNKNIQDFSKELYLNKKEVKEMSNLGMNFGIHGNYHMWWEHQSSKTINKEIQSPINFFNKITKNKKKLSICYPYGSYNKKVLSLIKNRNDISFALSTKVNCIKQKNLIREKLFYPRFDANDFKK